MNTIIASHFKSRITTNISWADRVFGVVRPLTRMQEKEGGSVKQTIPVSCDVNIRDCISNKQHHAVPDSTLKSLIYFEDQGATPSGRSVRGYFFVSTVKLVCWLNLQRLGQTSCAASAYAIAQLVELLSNSGASNVTPFNAVKVTEVSVDPKLPTIFSKYTYDETKNQFLIYPYDYFALTIKTSFEIPLGCINDSWVQSPIECLSNSPE